MTDGGEQRVRSKKSSVHYSWGDPSGASSHFPPCVWLNPLRCSGLIVQTRVLFSVSFIQCMQRSFVKPNIRGSYVHILDFILKNN